MPFITELDVVNGCLGTMGETPLNLITDDHPMVPAAQTAMRVASTREQAKSWWFNRELSTLTPEPGTGNIVVPADTIRIDPVDSTFNYVQRGSRLYQSHARAGVDKWVFTVPVECWLVRELDFVDLPMMAQELIRCAAMLDFQKDFDGDTSKGDKIADAYKAAWIQLNSEHIRNQNVNLLNRPAMRRVLGQARITS